MNVPNGITIVGGGLAGLTLGIGLRQRNVPVILWEAGRYPRHRVCGELISGRGQGVLSRLGLLDRLRDAGARRVRTSAFFLHDRLVMSRSLPQPALSLSRYKLDALLAGAFENLGGILRCEARWQGDYLADSVVRANGRRPRVTRGGCRWFGIKAHATNLSLVADLEMHFLRNAYVGLCRLSDNVVNVCGFFRRNPEERESHPSPVHRLQGESGTLLHARLSSVRWDEASIRAIGGLSLCPGRGGDTGEFSVGDALTMIAPATGNGMSMAFESAELAIEPLMARARDEWTWREAREGMAMRCNAAFARRLRWSALLQRGLFFKPIRQFVLPAAVKTGLGWKFLFHLTR